MAQEIRQRQALQALLHAVEPGLFAVTYRPDPAGWERHDLPVYQVGRCAADAKQRIEAAVEAAGYRSVIWEDELLATRSQRRCGSAPGLNGSRPPATQPEACNASLIAGRRPTA
jgi:hypothetical protein